MCGRHAPDESQEIHGCCPSSPQQEADPPDLPQPRLKLGLSSGVASTSGTISTSGQRAAASRLRRSAISSGGKAMLKERGGSLKTWMLSIVEAWGRKSEGKGEGGVALSSFRGVNLGRHEGQPQPSETPLPFLFLPSSHFFCDARQIKVPRALSRRCPPQSTRSRPSLGIVRFGLVRGLGRRERNQSGRSRRSADTRSSRAVNDSFALSGAGIPKRRAHGSQRM